MQQSSQINLRGPLAKSGDGDPPQCRHVQSVWKVQNCLSIGRKAKPTGGFKQRAKDTPSVQCLNKGQYLANSAANYTSCTFVNCLLAPSD